MMQVCDIDFNSSRNTTIQCLLGLMLTQNKKICYYYYNTVHISFYLEVISDFESIIFTLLYTGAFSLWSK